SFLNNPRDLCSLSCVNRALNDVSKEGSLWKPLCSPSWADKDKDEDESSTNWKAKYLDFLRLAVSKYTHSSTPSPVVVTSPDTSVHPPLKQPDSEIEEDYLISIVLLGDPEVGKTSLLLRFVKDIFDQKKIVTLGADFMIKAINFHGHRVRLHIWDKERTEIRSPVTLIRFHLSHAIFIVYDVSN